MVVDHVETAALRGEVDRLKRAGDVVDLIQGPLDLVWMCLSSNVTTVALDAEPGAQNSVTAWPRRTSASVSTLTTSSTPPYPGGGTEIHGGASMAMRSGLSRGRPRLSSRVLRAAPGLAQTRPPERGLPRRGPRASPDEPSQPARPQAER